MSYSLQRVPMMQANHAQLYDMGFVVYELDKRGDDMRIVAFGTNSAIALAAHRRACELYPEARFQTRHRARVVADTAEGSS